MATKRLLCITVPSLLLMISPCLCQTDGICDYADIGFVVDTSESTESNLAQVKDFLQQFVNRLSGIGPNAVQVGLVKYGSNAATEFNLNTYTNENDINAAIRDMAAMSGKTDTTSALELLQSDVFISGNGDRSDAPNIGVLITDARSNVRVDVLNQTAANLKASGVTIVAVGITSDIDINQLRAIASEPDDVIVVEDFSQLLDYLDPILNKTCKTRAVAEVCAVQADFALVLDSSTSINYNVNNWKNRIITFAVQLISRFKVGANDTRFGVTVFSSNANVEIYLDDYTDSNALISKVEQLPYYGGETNLAAALRETRERIFTAINGDRSFASNFMILMTDGYSNIDAHLTEEEAIKAQNQGIEIFTIGIGNAVEMDELNKIASDPDSQHVFEVTSFEVLASIQEMVFNAVCRQTTTTSTTTTTTTPSPTTPTTTTTTTTTPSTTTPTPTTPTPSTSTTPSSTARPTSPTTPSTSPTTPSPTTPSPTTPSPTTPSPTTPSPTTTPTTTSRSTTAQSTRPSLPTPAPCTSFANLVFVLDVSGSIEQRNFNKVIAFAVDIVEQLQVEAGNIRVGTMTFSTDVKAEFHLNEHDTRYGIIDALNAVEYRRGKTNTAAALKSLREVMFTPANGARSGVRNVAIVVTDGESNNRTETASEARLTKTAGIHIISLGIGNWLNVYELYTIASYPSDVNMKRVENFDALSSIVTLLRNAVCNNEQECELAGGNPCQNGGTCYNEIGYYRCECAPGFGGENCQYGCLTPADVVFAVDASGSIGNVNFQTLLDFVSDIVLTLDIDHPDNVGTRVGAITFATGVEPQFQLDDFHSKTEVMNALDMLYTRGTTNMAEALRYICETMFTAANGDRDNINNYIVMLTDGKSDNESATWEEAMSCRRQGVFILAVSIGSGTSNTELEGIVSEPVMDNVLYAQNWESLTQDIIGRVQDSVCDNKKECDPDPCENFGTCVEGMNGYTCNCPPDYLGKNCERNCLSQVDIIFALDSSGSIRNERWPIILEFISNITDQFEFKDLDRTRVGLIYWSDNAQIQFHMNQYRVKQDVKQAIKRTPFMAGTTHTSDMLQMVREEMMLTSRGYRTYTTTFVIIVTDGNSNVNELDTLPQAALLRVSGATIIMIPIGEKFANMKEINGMASEPTDQMVLQVDRFSQLPGKVSEIVEAACNDVNECNSDPCQNGGTCFDDVKRYDCECVNGYTGVNCERECSTSSTDLIFLLDVSGSTEEEFNMTTSVARETIYGVNMKFDLTRVGVVTFSTDARVMFNLIDYQDDKRSLINALRFAYTGGRTNIQAAFREAHNMLTPENGDRNGNKNIIVLVSDGYANENRAETMDEVRSVIQRGAIIFTVALGPNPDFSLINEISTDPDSESVIRLRSSSEIQQAVDVLLQRLCR